MLDIVNQKKIPDNEVVFDDGYIFIISMTKDRVITREEYIDRKYSVDMKLLNAEYDEPISLADIAEQYPKVEKVIYEDMLSGQVYNYGNHAAEKDAEMWELVGTTVGYL